jgi:sarcosine oxidase
MYDAIVIGLGGMGSAALAQLAQRGAKVLGLEQFAEGHELGSSVGRSRIIRMAYFEHPAYVPLLQRAYVLWRELEGAIGAPLVDLCGVLMVGRATGPTLAGARASATSYGLEVLELERAAVLRRYPTLQLAADEAGLFEPGAGMVFPERAIAAHLEVARRHGALTRHATPVRGFAARADGIVVTLADGSELRARRLAVCAGPWFGVVARELGLPIRVQRNVQVWFEPTTPAYRRDRFPVFFLERDGLPAPLYGFPDGGDGVKAALHGFGATTSPDHLERAIEPTDIAPIRAALADFMPGAAGEVRFGKACMYSLTPDEHFIIDRHPADDRIVIAGGFSGHGYKFCPVVGEIVADFVTAGATRHPIDFLRLDRLARAGSGA